MTWQMNISYTLNSCTWWHDRWTSATHLTPVSGNPPPCLLLMSKPQSRVLPHLLCLLLTTESHKYPHLLCLLLTTESHKYPHLLCLLLTTESHKYPHLLCLLLTTESHKYPQPRCSNLHRYSIFRPKLHTFVPVVQFAFTSTSSTKARL